MPAQTSERSYMIVKDGTKISVEAYGEVAYTDIGVCKGNAELKLNWTELQEQSANAGKSDAYAKNPECEITFTLQNLNMANISRMASGLFNLVATPGTANSSIPAQTIAAGWANNVKYPLIFLTSSSDSTQLKLPTKPTITSVTIATDTTPETLTEWSASASGDYTVVADSGSYSGWSIIFNSASMAVSDPTTRVITITHGTNTPTARNTYHIGTTVQALAPFKILMEHTDTAGKIRGREIHKCYATPGSINFSYGGADEDGFDEMQFTIKGVLDTTLTDGRQLMSVYNDVGAV